VAAVLGAIALAMWGVASDPGALPEGAVASVDGQPIARADFDALIVQVANQLAHPPDAAERAEILERMIDEELLIQRGIALGLPRSEGRLRSMLVQEVMNQALSGVRAQVVTDDDLATFYTQNAGYFSRPAELRVRRYGFPDATAAEQLRAALGAGMPSPQEFARARSPLLPDAGMPPAKLREYLGEELGARVAALATGESLEVPRDDGGIDVYLMVSARAASAPDLASVHAEVEAEFRRRRDERALSDYLRDLREQSRVIVQDAQR
jgi:hypothetical protein